MRLLPSGGPRQKSRQESQPPNTQVEPTLLTVHAILSSRDSFATLVPD